MSTYRGITIPEHPAIRESIPVCQYCGLRPTLIPDLTISADGRCGICDVEWKALQAEGWTHRQLVNRWNRAANHRRADRKQRIAAARAERELKVA